MKSSIECAVCAWRATCALKFSYEGGGQNCPEFTRDLTLGQEEEEEKKEKKEEEKKN